MDFLGTNIVHTQEELISAIYPNLETRLSDPKWLAERVIMAPKNESVHGLNNIQIYNLTLPNANVTRFLDGHTSSP